MRWMRRAISFHYRNYSTVIRKNGWESVVGLEVHAQIQAETKLFSRCGVDFGSPVNTLVSFFDASIPGTLPVLNRRCVEAAVATASALSCHVNMVSTFDRKHYFYADLPAGYQITQQRKPIAENGELKFLVIFPGEKPYYKTCQIRQLQLEQDSGKSLHDTETDRSLIDLNRAGIALMELVFQPDLRSGEEAAALVKELSLILQALHVCSCRMEEGALRVDANVSVNRSGDGLGTRTEIKNLSSTRSLVNSIEYEIIRQIELLEMGGTVTNETRSYDSERKITLPMRDKEIQQDYRFMPEPNLPPLLLDDNAAEVANPLPNRVNIAKITETIIDLPETVRHDLIAKYNLRIETAHIIVSTPGLVTYYLAVMKNIPKDHGVRAANLLLTEIMDKLHERELTYENCPLKPEIVSELVLLIQQDYIHLSSAKDVLELLFAGDTRSPRMIVGDNKWVKVTDDSLIEYECLRVLNENPTLVENYLLKQRPKYFNKLMGLVKANAKVKIDMKKVSEILQKKINSKGK